MKISLGDEFAIDLKEKISWIRSNFKKDQYKIVEEGFLINDYYVDFVDDKYATFYLLNCPSILSK